MTFAADPTGPPSSLPPPWGIPATIIWLLLALLISAVVATGLFVAWQGENARSFGKYDGVMITVGVVTSFSVQIVVLAWAAQLRGWPPAGYFALTMPRRAELILALIAMAAIILVFNALLYLTGHDLVPSFQVEAYRSAQNAGWLLWFTLAIVVVAPIAEEIVFRGFLYRGLARPGREILAIVVIAAAWALLHIQYDWIGMLQIFMLGLVLGWFRWASGSTTLSIVMHILINLEAVIETAIKVELLS